MKNPLTLKILSCIIPLVGVVSNIQAAESICEVPATQSIAKARVSFSPTDISLNSNPSPGTILWQQEKMASFDTPFNCQNNIQLVGVNLLGSDSGLTLWGGVKVYNTNIKGIGYAVKIQSTGDLANSGQSQWPLNTVIGGISQLNTVKTTLALVATGNVGTGMITTGKLAELKIGELAQLDIYISSGVLKNSSCSFDDGETRLIQMPAGLTTKSFSGVGSFAGEKTFSMGVTCAIAPTESLKFRFTGDFSDSINGVLVSSGEAKGIGIQVLLNQEPIKPETDYEAVITPVGASGAKSQIDLKARYYQSSVPMTSGSVSSLMTINMTYQ